MTGLAIAALLAGCAPTDGGLDSGVAGAVPVPEHFPAMPVPDDNPLTAAKVALGRHLFYDTRLSGNGTTSCASCHEQARAFSDGRAVAVGSTGELHSRNSQALVNVAYNASYNWANPLITDLEHQALGPMFGDTPVELGLQQADGDVVAELAADPVYDALLADAFPDETDAWTWDHVVAGLASFVRALVSGDAPFDRYVYGGDADALSDAQLRGMDLFYSERLECHHCHGGFNFSEATTHADSPFDSALFQNTGLYNIDGAGAYPNDNLGTYAVTGDPADMGRHRAPTLRNVAVSAPYTHDGSVANLEDMVAIYERGGRLIEDGPYAGDGAESPLKSGLVAGFTLTDQERADLVAFLDALTDEAFLTDPRFSDPWAPE